MQQFTVLWKNNSLTIISKTEHLLWIDILYYSVANINKVTYVNTKSTTATPKMCMASTIFKLIYPMNSQKIRLDISKRLNTAS